MPAYSEHIEKKEVKLNIVEMAKKKRHIYLLEKLQTGKPLSKAEVNELEKLEAGPNPAGYLSSQEEVAEVFGVKPRTIRRWLAAGMPKDAFGYNIVKIQEWKQNRHYYEESYEKTIIRETMIVGIRHGIDLVESMIRRNIKIISRDLCNKPSKEIEELLDRKIRLLAMLLLEHDELKTSESEEVEDEEYLSE